MSKFFVFCLPRSGSSWLSVFLSGPGCYCYHEPLADGDLFALAKRISARSETCAGAVDTSAYQREDLDFGEYRTFVLVREPTQIQRSLKMRGWSMGNIETQQDRLLEKAKGAMQIEYEKLIDIGYLAEIWDKVTEGMPFDEERTVYLREMNIQRNVLSVIKRVASL